LRRLPAEAGSGRLELMTELRKPSRKLLIAAVGVATINYVACGTSHPPTSGNLPAPPDDAGVDSGVDAGNPISGNLLPPPDAAQPEEDAGVDSGSPISGNLVPPPPDDAGPSQ
jgi:hypothetical protein